jgi:hypothetical protein
LQSGEQGSVDLNSIPQILLAQIFVFGVLVVVVIGDRKTNDRRIAGPLQQEHGKAAADGRQAYRLVTGGGHQSGHFT